MIATPGAVALIGWELSTKSHISGGRSSFRIPCSPNGRKSCSRSGWRVCSCASSSVSLPKETTSSSYSISPVRPRPCSIWGVAGAAMEPTITLRSMSLAEGPATITAPIVQGSGVDPVTVMGIPDKDNDFMSRSGSEQTSTLSVPTVLQLADEDMGSISTSRVGSSESFSSAATEFADIEGMTEVRNISTSVIAAGGGELATLLRVLSLFDVGSSSAESCETFFNFSSK